MKLIRPLAMAALPAGALLASSGFTYAATFNQSLQTLPGLPAVMPLGDETPPVVVSAQRGRPVIYAQATTKTPQPTPATTPSPSSADIVNKLLSPGPSDPNVPLPRADLAGETGDSGASKRPQIFGRQEEGGGIFGLRVPIPADRSATRYSPPPSSLGAAPEAR